MGRVVPIKKVDIAQLAREVEAQRRHEYNTWRNLISDEIRQRYTSGTTLKEMAEKTGLCTTTIHNLVYKPTPFPRMDTVFRVLRYLGYTLYAEKK